MLAEEPAAPEISPAEMAANGTPMPMTEDVSVQ
jgi:hypothetical protein